MNQVTARKIHLWVGLLFAVPALMIFTTGILLQIKNQVTWIQPQVLKAAGKELNLNLEDVLVLSRSVEEAQVKEWSDIAQVDWRPDKGLIRVRTANWTEIQIDVSTKQILTYGKRWTALIISLHEGTWFSSAVKYGIFLPTALALWALWFTGVWIGLKTIRLKYFKKTGTK